MSDATRLDALTVDVHDDEEQLTGFLTGAEGARAGLEAATVVGVPVQVVEVDADPTPTAG